MTIATIVGSPLGTFVGQQANWRALYVVVALIGLTADAAIRLRAGRCGVERGHRQAAGEDRRAGSVVLEAMRAENRDGLAHALRVISA
ncbi:hypothetical protein AB0H88_18755 [Nonomuraea sp. NPDC050680]|uniref:hypothetical protein n=1 Tax=Nonomuraea sp. NPDC050680 TaxID=3154630 RepID=UPI0033D4FFF2